MSMSDQEWQEVVVGLAQEVEQLAGHVRVLQRAQSQASGAPPDAGTDEPVEDERDPHELLVEWVSWLAEEYYLTVYLRGWEDNSAIAAELRALHSAHVAATADDAGAWDALSWHDHLTRVLGRIGTSKEGGNTHRGRAEVAAQHRAQQPRQSWPTIVRRGS